MALPPGFLLLLLLCLAGGTVSRHISGDLEYMLPTPHYETEDEISTSGKTLSGLAWLPHAFLSLVVPQAFPQDIMREIIKNKFGFKSTNINQVVYYELGILICAILGLIFIILMPVVGFCFCMCRFCNKCGGKMHQREKERGPYLRRNYAISLFVLSIIISFGIVCGFLANRHLTNVSTKAMRLAESNIKDLRTFLNFTPAQIDFVLDKYNPTKEKAFSDLDNIQSLLGDRIHQALKPQVLPVLTDVLSMALVIRRTKESLMYANQNLTELRIASQQLSSSLQQVKNNMEQTLNSNDCKNQPSCENILSSLSDLDNNNNLAQLPSLDDKVHRIDEVDKINLLFLAEKGIATFNNIPEMVQSQTQNFIADIKKRLNSTGSQLENITKDLPIQDMIANFTRNIDDFESTIDPYFALMEKYDLYGWVIKLTLCFLLTIIVTFYFLGLLCGTIGYSKRATPTTRGCVSNTGGIFLMVGVGFSFLVGWIIMLFVVLTFVVGGNVEKLVCEPYQNQKLLQILDTPYLLNGQWKYYLSGLILDDPEVVLTIEETYNRCKDNQALYTVFKMDTKYNISEKLNIKKLTSHINQEFDNMKIDLSEVVVLDENGKQGLKEFSAAGVQNLHYDVFLTEISKPPTRGDLLLFARKVESEANNLPTQGAARMDLLKEAQSIKGIYQDKLVPLQEIKSQAEISLRELQQVTNNLGERVDHLISSLESAQGFLATNGSIVIREESRKYANSIMWNFENYLKWVKKVITEDVATCKPMATALDSTVEVFLCSYIINPVNVFWFSLGKATFLLLPALILAVKLAKYYRRMQSEDVYYEYTNYDSTAASSTGKETISS